jgi:hypothetical protein
MVRADDPAGSATMSKDGWSELLTTVPRASSTDEEMLGMSR